MTDRYKEAGVDLDAAERAVLALQRSRDLENNMLADLDLFSAAAPIRNRVTKRASRR